MSSKGGKGLLGGRSSGSHVDLTTKSLGSCCVSLPKDVCQSTCPKCSLFSQKVGDSQDFPFYLDKILIQFFVILSDLVAAVEAIFAVLFGFYLLCLENCPLLRNSCPPGKVHFVEKQQDRRFAHFFLVLVVVWLVWGWFHVVVDVVAVVIGDVWVVLVLV